MNEEPGGPAATFATKQLGEAYDALALTLLRSASWSARPAAVWRTEHFSQAVFPWPSPTARLKRSGMSPRVGGRSGASTEATRRLSTWSRDRADDPNRGALPVSGNWVGAAALRHVYDAALAR